MGAKESVAGRSTSYASPGHYCVTPCHVILCRVSWRFELPDVGVKDFDTGAAISKECKLVRESSGLSTWPRGSPRLANGDRGGGFRASTDRRQPGMSLFPLFMNPL